MKTLALPAPKPLDMTLGDALGARRSVRDCRTDDIPPETLSALLWAAAGLTTEDGRRTTPSTLDLRAVSVWVVRADGAWRYDAARNVLEQTAEEDLRELTTAYQFEYVLKAPVTLVFAADLERAKTARTGAVFVDAGTMAQSASLAAAALGLSGCVRASFEHDPLARAMHLPEHSEPILLYTVGCAR